MFASKCNAASVDKVYAYSPYGETVALGPDKGNSLQYTGRENDGYDPELKRWAVPFRSTLIALIGGAVALTPTVLLAALGGQGMGALWLQLEFLPFAIAGAVFSLLLDALLFSGLFVAA